MKWKETTRSAMIFTSIWLAWTRHHGVLLCFSFSFSRIQEGFCFIVLFRTSALKPSVPFQLISPVHYRLSPCSCSLDFFPLWPRPGPFFFPSKKRVTYPLPLPTLRDLALRSCPTARDLPTTGLPKRMDVYCGRVRDGKARKNEDRPPRGSLRPHRCLLAS